MLEFVITAILFGVVVGSFVAMMFCVNFHKWWSKLICAVVCMAVTGTFIAGVFQIERWADESLWNDGVCPYCETEWVFSNADRSRHGTTHYFWYCPDCNEVIDLTNQF